MMMALQLTQRQALLQELAVQAEDAATNSIFPIVELWLRDDDHVKALLYVASRKSAKNYQSIVDWMYCETR